MVEAVSAERQSLVRAPGRKLFRRMLVCLVRGLLPETRGQMLLAASAFVAYAALAVHVVPPSGEVAKAYGVLGYDYGMYVNDDTSVKHAVESVWDIWRHVRHPFFSILLAPVIAIAHGVRLVAGMYYAHLSICLFHCAGMALCLVLVYKIARKGAGVSAGSALLVTVLFASFGHTLVLALVPESFSISMLVLLLMVYMTVEPERLPAGPDLTYGFFLVVLSGITITNGAKAAIVRAMVPGTRRAYARWLLLSGGAFLLLLLAFHGLVRLAVYALGVESIFQPPLSLAHAYQYHVTQWTPPVASMLECVWQNFISEPILLHAVDWAAGDQGIPPYSPAWQAWSVLLFCLLPLGGLVLGLRHRLVQAMVAMFAVDLFLHVLCRHGIAEGQIYAGHWFFILPLLTAFLLKAARGRTAVVSAHAAVLLFSLLFLWINGTTVLRSVGS